LLGHSKQDFVVAMSIRTSVLFYWVENLFHSVHSGASRMKFWRLLSGIMLSSNL